MLETHTDRVVDLAWSLDGAWLVSASSDGSLALTEAASQRLAHLITGDFIAVAVARHGEWISTAARRAGSSCGCRIRISPCGAGDRRNGGNGLRSGG